MKQLTWNEAESIAESAVKQAEGFGADLDVIKKLTPDQHVAEARKLAVKAAAIALRLAGCLNQSNANDRKAIDRAATRAHQAHRAWCKKTGSAF